MKDEEGERGNEIGDERGENKNENKNKNKNKDEDGIECRPSDFRLIFILFVTTIVNSASNFYDIIIGNST